MTTSPRPHATSEILDRLPPQDLAAERSCLGSLLLNPNLLDDVALIVQPEDFYGDANQRIYARLLVMHDANQRIDRILLVDRLKQAGELEVVGGIAYLVELTESVAIPAYAVYHAQIVRNKATLRVLINTGTEMIRDSYDVSADPDSLLADAAGRIGTVEDRRSATNVQTIQDILPAALIEIDSRKNGRPAGLKTGYPDLDRIIIGLQPGALNILAARPGVGKTALALNIAERVASNGSNSVLFISLEMSKQELAERLLCSASRVDSSRVRGGTINAADSDKIIEASSRLAAMPISIEDTGGLTVRQIASLARRQKRSKSGLKLLLVDYLQLVEPEPCYGKHPSRQEQVAAMSRGFKRLAKQLEIPIVCLAQLNRDADSKERPRLSHLRESGAIEQDADVVLLMHNPAGDEEQSSEIEVSVAKQRNGPNGTVKLHWMRQYTRFEPAAPKAYKEFTAFDGTQEPSSDPDSCDYGNSGGSTWVP